MLANGGRWWSPAACTEGTSLLHSAEDVESGPCYGGLPYPDPPPSTRSPLPQRPWLYPLLAVVLLSACVTGIGLVYCAWTPGTALLGGVHLAVLPGGRAWEGHTDSEATSAPSNASTHYAGALVHPPDGAPKAPASPPSGPRTHSNTEAARPDHRLSPGPGPDPDRGAVAKRPEHGPDQSDTDQSAAVTALDPILPGQRSGATTSGHRMSPGPTNRTSGAGHPPNRSSKPELPAFPSGPPSPSSISHTDPRTAAPASSVPNPNLTHDPSLGPFLDHKPNFGPNPPTDHESDQNSVTNHNPNPKPNHNRSHNHEPQPTSNPLHGPSPKQSPEPTLVGTPSPSPGPNFNHDPNFSPNPPPNHNSNQNSATNHHRNHNRKPGTAAHPLPDPSPQQNPEPTPNPKSDPSLNPNPNVNPNPTGVHRPMTHTGTWPFPWPFPIPAEGPQGTGTLAPSTPPLPLPFPLPEGIPLPQVPPWLRPRYPLPDPFANLTAFNITSPWLPRWPPRRHPNATHPFPWPTLVNLTRPVLHDPEVVRLSHCSAVFAEAVVAGAFVCAVLLPVLLATLSCLSFTSLAAAAAAYAAFHVSMARPLVQVIRVCVVTGVRAFRVLPIVYQPAPLTAFAVTGAVAVAGVMYVWGCEISDCPCH